MIPDFHVQAMRIGETKRWLGLLKSALEEGIGEHSTLLRDYSPNWTRLALDYDVQFSSSDETIELVNGNARIDIKSNRPVGWITVTATKTNGFRDRESLGALSAEYIGHGQRPMDADRYSIKTIGMLSGLQNIREIADKLIAFLYDSELTEEDCLI